MTKVSKDKKAALEEMEMYLRNAKNSLKEARKVADKHGFDFFWDECGYGMGGRYYGENSEARNQFEDYELDDGWRASSQSC